MAGLLNNASQHWNHLQFWQMMKKNGGGAIPGALEKKIVEDLGSVADFQAAFIEAGVTQFGSGWCWLAMGSDGKLKVTKTPNGKARWRMEKLFFSVATCGSIPTISITATAVPTM